MCGIAGFLTSEAWSEDQLERQALRMSDAISHRGPDGDGAWCDEAAGIAISHRRLSIVDLSSSGSQPMTSACGRLVMVYNGEVYNFSELKTELTALGVQFRGTSDSEVILEGFAKWGIEETVKRLIGMFAIAVWNRDNRQLTLVRDRLGIKPLYWGSNGGLLLFGSELKALKAHPECPTALDHNAIANFLRKGYVNAPNSIYSGVNKLESGCILTHESGKQPTISRYWSMHDVALQGMDQIDTRDENKIVDALEELLSDSIKMRMVADVPLGAFLSGGIDSSAVVALMQKQSARPIKTFSIGFEEKQYNESHHAASVAEHLGTDHTEMYITAKDALDLIPTLHTMYDEPFADASQIPTFLVSKLTRQHVTVALSGDGGDELFAGYERYFEAEKYQRLFKQPAFARNIEAGVLGSIPPRLLQKASQLLPDKLGRKFHPTRMKRLHRILRDGHPLSLYQQFLWRLDNDHDLQCSLINPAVIHDPVWDRARSQHFDSDFNMMQYVDAQDYLTDDILAKVDRASMAASLEARVPILDHRVVEFAWRLPEHMKVRNGQGKWALREVLYRHVPRELIDRPKMGFGVPIDEWLRGPLREWAENLLSRESLKDTGVLNVEVIRERWQQHLKGSWNWQYHLWDVLMLQDWIVSNKH